MNRTAKLLFDILTKSFERQSIKEFHKIIGGMRAVVAHEGINYQVTLRPIEEPQDSIDLDDMAKQHVSGFEYTGIAAKDKK